MRVPACMDISPQCIAEQGGSFFGGEERFLESTVFDSKFFYFLKHLAVVIPVKVPVSLTFRVSEEIEVAVVKVQNGIQKIAVG